MAEESRIIIDAQLQFRHDSEAAWYEHDPVLKAGEPAYTLGYPDRFKLGDGQSKWSELPYIKPGEGGGGGGGSQSYESLTWSAIKGLTSGDPSILPQAFAVKQAYNELKSLIPVLDDYYTKTEVDSRIPSLAGYATETFVNTAIANLINGAPTTLDTLKEIADALADNADVVDALERAIGTKADASTVEALDTRLDTAVANISTNSTTITSQGKTIASHTTSIGTLTSDVSRLKTSVSDLEGLFDSDGKALKAVTADNATKLGGQLPSYYATASALTALTTRVSTAETNITNLTNNKLNKSVWDSVFEIDASGNLKVKVGLYSTKFISSREADPNTGGGSGGAFSLYTWSQIKTLASEVSGVAPTAYALKQAYDELNTSLGARIDSLASKATNVSVSQTLTTGTEIGKITIDGVSRALYAPSSIAWDSVTGKPSFATVATSGKYSDLSGLPTIPSIAGLASETWVGSNYLPLSGGTITGGVGVYTPLVIKNTNLSEVWIQFQDDTGTTHIGSAKGVPSINSGSDNQTLIHSGNYSSYALPLSGGTIRGSVIISGNANTNVPLNIATPSMGYTGYIRFGAGSNTNELGHLGFSAKGVPAMSYEGTTNTLIHSGNIGSYKAGDSAKLGGYDASVYPTFENQGTVIGFNLHTDYIKLGQGDGHIEFYDGGWYNSVWGKVTAVNGFVGTLTGNASSATKLQTARTIWGQSFDGTGDVDGYLRMSGLAVLHLDESNLWLNYGAADDGKSLRLCGNDVAIYYGKSSNFARAMTINSSGNVLIGTTTDDGVNKLQVLGSQRIYRSGDYRTYLDISLDDVKCTFNAYDTDGWTDYYFKSCGNEILILNGRTLQATFAGGVYATTGTFSSNITATGTIYSATGVYSSGYVSARGADSSSDRRLKDNIAPIKNALNYVLGTNYVSFDWKDTREKSIGIIAQEEMGREWGCLVQKHSETYSYLYGQHTALLGAAIQEEDKKVEGLKRRIDELETRNETLEKEVSKLRMRLS